jgi:hypothetical protein
MRQVVKALVVVVVAAVPVGAATKCEIFSERWTFFA